MAATKMTLVGTDLGDHGAAEVETGHVHRIPAHALIHRDRHTVIQSGSGRVNTLNRVITKSES